MSQPKEFRQVRFRPPKGATELVLVRHGESEAMVEGVEHPRVDDHSDPPLHPEGIIQAQRVGERLANERIDAIYVTTLQRTHQTAAPLAEKLGLTPIVVPELREIHLGEWEGTYRKHVTEGHPIAMQLFVEQRWDVIPGAESAEVFAARVKLGVEKIANAHPDGRIAVFVHGGIIGEIIAQATGAKSFAFTGSDNGSISHLVVMGPRWIVRRYNDTTHLDNELTAEPEPLT